MGLALRRPASAVELELELKPSVELNRSKDDICRSSFDREPSRSASGNGVEGFGGERELTRLKLRMRENVDVSDRALRAGEGGDRSGRGKSSIGGFQ